MEWLTGPDQNEVDIGKYNAKVITIYQLIFAVRYFHK